MKAVNSFVFGNDIEKGLRIYKTDSETGAPIPDMEFNVYRADEATGDKPSQEDIERFAVESGKVGSIVTDSTGYASLTLEDGKYLVVEAPAPDIVEAPAVPFFINVPEVDPDTGESSPIASAYPKNALKITYEEPPDLIIPDNVKGAFSIVKHKTGDTGTLLEGAEFQVYRPANYEDDEYVTLEGSNGSYAAVPVTVGEDELVLRTDGSGKAVSPELPCGTYYLVETKAPLAYHKSSEIFKVTAIMDIIDNPIEPVYIANSTGSILPETGGIGTYVFTFGGSALMIAAAVTAIAKRKKKKKYLSVTQNDG